MELYFGGFVADFKSHHSVTQRDEGIVGPTFFKRIDHGDDVGIDVICREASIAPFAHEIVVTSIRFENGFEHASRHFGVAIIVEECGAIDAHGGGGFIEFDGDGDIVQCFFGLTI